MGIIRDAIKSFKQDQQEHTDALVEELYQIDKEKREVEKVWILRNESQFDDWWADRRVSYYYPADIKEYYKDSAIERMIYGDIDVNSPYRNSLNLKDTNRTMIEGDL